MNKENILALADFIESRKYRFDMTRPRANPSCRTAGCIGGHAAVLWPELRTPRLKDRSFGWGWENLRAKLGISEAQHKRLCFWCYNRKGELVPLYYITRKMAVATLHRLAETGEVYFE